MARKIEVEFDNYDEDTDGYTPLKKSDVVLDLPGHGTLVPVSMFDGRHATYDLPDGATDEDLEEALDKCSWCHTGVTDLSPEEDPAP